MKTFEFVVTTWVLFILVPLWFYYFFKMMKRTMKRMSGGGRQWK